MVDYANASVLAGVLVLMTSIVIPAASVVAAALAMWAFRRPVRWRAVKVAAGCIAIPWAITIVASSLVRGGMLAAIASDPFDKRLPFVSLPVAVGIVVAWARHALRSSDGDR